MAGEKQDTTWPIPKFYFSVRFGDDTDVRFQEVSGLESEPGVIEYRRGNNPAFSPIKMPGRAKVGNVTMKKGVLAKNAKVWDWLAETRMNTVARRDVTVSLLDEKGAATMTWILRKAWVIKYAAADLKADGNDIAVESIEIAHESLEVKNA